ncbi:MAG: ComEA family DNA-binding protein [Acidobacteria bacterium]|nr:ComEA family DNA-binding protein [Acidobacteriota bacterium]
MRRFVTGIAVLCALLGAGAEGGAWEAQDARSEPTVERATPGADLVDINRATLAELDTLPGVGPRTAQRILEYREENDGFTRIEELMNVRGIGERTFLRLKPLVTVGPSDER